MKCPFRKTTNYVAYQNTGGGYPSEWITNEGFEECIGEECAAFGKAPADIWDKESEVITFCCLCHSDC